MSDLNVIDVNFINPRKEMIRKQVQKFLDTNQFKQVRLYIEDKNNTFLGVSVCSYNYQNMYKQTEIIVPAIQEDSIYEIKDDPDFDQCDGIIMFKQINGNVNNIHFSEDVINDKKAIIITFETKSEYGVYDTYSMDMYIDPLW